MAKKQSAFENIYDDFSPEAATSILNNSNDGISGKFHTKLENFKEVKLKLLTTKLNKEIFCNSSVYTGSAGLGLYYFMLGIKNGDNPELFKQALDYIDVDKLSNNKISFLCGDAGPLAIATLVSYKLGSKRPANLPEYKSLAHRLMSLSALMDKSPDEILYGKSGYLFALLFVNKHIHGKELIPASHIVKVTSSILKSGKLFSTQVKAESPLLWQWHDKIYYGAAHGMAGILYMLLQARLYINIVEIRTFIKPSIDWLLNRRFPSGNFPSSMESNNGDKLVQWCHGAPGFVALCTLAAQIFEDEKYLAIAKQACDVIWDRGICTKGYSLCHGVSGNAYSFIQLYQITKKPKHLYRACCFMEWCAVEQTGAERHQPDRPASLFEGLVGRLYLASDLMHISDAKFPGFTV